ncbi:hypothetical protein ACO0LG_16760 [Undibacterium sp. Ji42W]|uniref:hypothetical protein n=1 Tax=Undibacterium sp. Ji42W TaxID=3413039 RepID=UPI003BF03F02
MHVKSAPVGYFSDECANAAVGQIMLRFGEPHWESSNMSNNQPFNLKIAFDCQKFWVRSREILVMQLCKDLYLKFGGYYLVSRDDSPIVFWLGDVGFFLNEADRNYYDWFPHNFINRDFVARSFNT